MRRSLGAPRLPAATGALLPLPPAFRRANLSRYLGSVDHGQSRAQRFDADDGANYIVKFAENPEGARVLANELVVAGLAKLLGAPCPEGVIAHASARVLRDQPLLATSLGAQPSEGPHFGSCTVHQAFSDGGPGIVFNLRDKLSNRHEFPALVVLDVWTRNQDRDGGDNILLAPVGRDSFRVIGIDHADCFATARWKAHQLHGLVETWAPVVHRDVARLITGDAPFAETLGRLSGITETAIRGVVGQVPDAWGLDAEDREALTRFLTAQRDAVPKLLESHRSKFPGWITKGGASG